MLYLHSFASVHFPYNRSHQELRADSMNFLLWPFRRLAASHPARDVFAALAFKGALLLVIYLLFFSPSHRVPADSAATANALLGVYPSKDAP